MRLRHRAVRFSLPPCSVGPAPPAGILAVCSIEPIPGAGSHIEKRGVWHEKPRASQSVCTHVATLIMKKSNQHIE